jgi:hypothetical protein
LGSICSQWMTSFTGRRSGASQRTVGPMIVPPTASGVTVRPEPIQTGPMNCTPGSTCAWASRQTASF